jgi:hypothetical protein
VPIITTSYSVSVISVDGCEDEDSMTLFVEKNEDIYIPNIFSPNGDGINDAFAGKHGKGCRKKYHPWRYLTGGEILFFQPSIYLLMILIIHGMGHGKGRLLNNGVFVYKVIVEFKDGRSEMRYGDVTLIK